MNNSYTMNNDYDREDFPKKGFALATQIALRLQSDIMACAAGASEPCQAFVVEGSDDPHCLPLDFGTDEVSEIRDFLLLDFVRHVGGKIAAFLDFIRDDNDRIVQMRIYAVAPDELACLLEAQVRGDEIGDVYLVTGSSPEDQRIARSLRRALAVSQIDWDSLCVS